MAAIVSGEQARQALGPLLELAGELLPLPFGGQELRLLNVTQVVECLDYGSLRIKPPKDLVPGLHLQSYAFDESRLPNSSIFKIPETSATEVLCSEGLRNPKLEFKATVERVGLKGLLFRRLWPQPDARPLVDFGVPIHPRLTRADIDRAPDEQVDAVVFSALNELRQHQSPTQEEEYVQSLTPGLRMVWTTDLVDGEVRNGGFNQLFWNSHGSTARQAIADFHLIGAGEHAQLVQDAVDLFAQDWRKLRPFYEEGSLQALSESYNHTDLSRLDDRYLQLPDFRPKRIACIREHPDAFILN